MNPPNGDNEAERASRFNLLRGARVLLVEDNEINQMVAQEILKDMFIQVDVAGNGQEALKAMALQVYYAVLMDLQMMSKA